MWTGTEAILCCNTTLSKEKDEAQETQFDATAASISMLPCKSLQAMCAALMWPILTEAFSCAGWRDEMDSEGTWYWQGRCCSAVAREWITILGSLGSILRWLTVAADIRATEYLSSPISLPVTFSCTTLLGAHTCTYHTIILVGFPYVGKNHPNWLIFFRGVKTTNQITWCEAVLTCSKYCSICFAHVLLLSETEE